MWGQLEIHLFAWRCMSVDGVQFSQLSANCSPYTERYCVATIFRLRELTQTQNLIQSQYTQFYIWLYYWYLYNKNVSSVNMKTLWQWERRPGSNEPSSNYHTNLMLLLALWIFIVSSSSLFRCSDYNFTGSFYDEPVNSEPITWS